MPVDLPAAQLTQAMVEAVLYLATGHAVQVVAPAFANVLVTEPGEQVAHAVVEDALYLPASQAVQVVAAELTATALPVFA